MGDPDVILRIHGHAGHRAEDLMITKWLRPQRIGFEPRRLRSASLRERLVLHDRHACEKEREDARAATENMIPLHPAGLLQATPLDSRAVSIEPFEPVELSCLLMARLLQRPARGNDRNRPALCVLGVAAAALLLLPARSAAHDIPNDITIQTFLKPEGSRLRLVIRVPLASINDIDWPLNRDGTLDLARADRALHDASTQWLADFIDLYEGQTRLAYPRVVEVRASLP